MRTLIPLILVLFGGTASAGPTQGLSSLPVGENVQVKIRYLPSGIWGEVFELKNGFSSGSGLIRVLPVTREAYEIVRGLDKKLTYECAILKSTLEESRSNGQFLGATYYVIDIDCR